MTDDIVHEATYPHPPEAVWRAITTPEAMSAWLMQTDFREPTVGHRFQFRDKPKKVVGWDGITNCEVLEADPPRRFVIRFGDANDGGTFVSWDIQPTDGGTRLRLRHWGFTGFKGWLMRQGMKQGWGSIVRHAIPFVLHEMGEGRMPSRDETRRVAEEGFPADDHAAKARS